MSDQESHSSARFREIEIERLVVREPAHGRVRAILEAIPATDDDGVAQVPVVRLTMMTPAGEPALVLEVGKDGAPMLAVGHPDHGVSAVIRRNAVDLWMRGNIVAALRSTTVGGRLELTEPSGRTFLDLPAPDAFE